MGELDLRSVLEGELESTEKVAGKKVFLQGKKRSKSGEMIAWYRIQVKMSCNDQLIHHERRYLSQDLQFF